MDKRVYKNSTNNISQMFFFFLFLCIFTVFLFFSVFDFFRIIQPNQQSELCLLSLSALAIFHE